MKFECKDLERALEVPELMDDARKHARNCPACQHELWVWAEMSRIAGGLREEWESVDLWPRIRVKLAAERRPKPLNLNWKALGAIAALVLMTICGALFFPRQRPTTDFLTERTLREVEQSELGYERSIEKLTQVTESKLRQPGSALGVSYREKLLTLDSAIADLRSSVEENRFNARLRTELAAIYKQKQEVLQEVVKNEQNN